MKIKFFIAAVALVMCLVSCDLEVSDNGNLDGFWHLERVDTLKTGGMTDLSDQFLFWSVQMDLMELSKRDHDTAFVLFRFEKKDGVLRVYNPMLFDGTDSEIPVDDLSVLMPYGINSFDETLRVVTLSSGRMVLETDRLRFSFTKM